MSEDTKKKAAEAAAEEAEKTEQQPEAAADKAETAKAEKPEKPEKPSKHKSGADEKLREAEQKLAAEHDGYLRLAAEYDNFRKRSQREKDGIYRDAVSDTVKKLLPVYDNLQRALLSETSDEAYKKGVEMTMTELKKIFTGLGVEAFGEKGDPFDPARHNAVMHVEDESLAENVIAQVFQTGFTLGDKVIRFAMVKVAN